MERKCPENELDDGSLFFFFMYLGTRFKVETVRKPLAFIVENMNGTFTGVAQIVYSIPLILPRFWKILYSLNDIFCTISGGAMKIEQEK